MKVKTNILVVVFSLAVAASFANGIGESAKKSTNSS